MYIKTLTNKKRALRLNRNALVLITMTLYVHSQKMSIRFFIFIQYAFSQILNQTDFCIIMLALFIFNAKMVPALSYKICKDNGFLLRRINTCFLTGFNTFQIICHISAQKTHRLHTFQILFNLISTGAVHHIPIS